MQLLVVIQVLEEIGGKQKVGTRLMDLPIMLRYLICHRFEKDLVTYLEMLRLLVEL